MLRETEQPLASAEIAHRITQKVLGATPASTVATTLSAMVEAGTVVRTEREVYSLNGEYYAAAETAVADDSESVAITTQSKPAKRGALTRPLRRRKGDIHVATAIGLLMSVTAALLACVGFMGWIMVDCPPFKAQFPPAELSCSLFFSLASIEMLMALVGVALAGVADIITMPSD